MKKLFIIALMACPLWSKAQLADSNARLVRMEGAVNFRDIGGYKTTDGKQVRWTKIYRSADVSRLTDNDLAILEQKQIHTVIDFRGVKEAQKAPDHLLPNTDYTLCPAGSDSLPDMQKIAEQITSGQFLTGFYTNTQYLGARYKPFFQKLLALPDNQSMMYHCTGGRDRTGIATALLLYALGVPEETIEADFTASNIYLKPMNERMFGGLSQNGKIDVEKVKKALELKPELIQSLFAAIRKQYGSMDQFFSKELGIGPEEIKQLRSKYTI